MLDYRIDSRVETVSPADDFATFIAMTLMIARKMITAVFVTMGLQLIYLVSMSLFCLSHSFLFIILLSQLGHK